MLYILSSNVWHRNEEFDRGNYKKTLEAFEIFYCRMLRDYWIELMPSTKYSTKVKKMETKKS